MVRSEEEKKPWIFFWRISKKKLLKYLKSVDQAKQQQKHFENNEYKEKLNEKDRDRSK